jgi:hypothetical protein
VQGSWWRRSKEGRRTITEVWHEYLKLAMRGWTKGTNRRRTE